MQTTYFGVLKFEVWEMVFVPVLILVIFAIAFFIKKTNERLAPEYSYFLPGLGVKVLSGLLFACVYMYYYKGGDTMMYYQSALAFANLFYEQPYESISVLFSAPSKENLSVFTLETGYPLWYLYKDVQSFSVIRFTTPLLIICFKSYLLTTVLLAAFSYFSVWKAYRLFCSYYPTLNIHFAIAFLFLPSVVFWSSGILKDTFTFSATCLFIVAFHNLFIKPKRVFTNIIYLCLGFYFLVFIKPYIIIVLLPGSVIWVLHSKLSRMKNRLLAIFVGPILYLSSILGVVLFFILIGSSLGDYALDSIFEKAVITQNDLVKENYGTNSFDIGGFEPSATGVIKKAPIAIISGLFRPFIWEATTPFILLSALEGLTLVLLSIRVLIFSGFINSIKAIFRNPILVFCLSFSILYAFSIGLTTANFGALVRFKITCLPFYLMAWFIIKKEVELTKQRKLKSFNLKASQVSVT